MRFIRTVILSLRVWQILSLSPFAISRKKLRPNLNNFYNIIAIAIILIIFTGLIHGWIYNQQYVKWENRLQAYYNIYALNFTKILALLHIIESCYKRTLQLKFFEKINRIDSILCYKLNINIDFEQQRRENIIKTSLWILLSLFYYFLLILLSYLHNGDLKPVYYVFVSFPNFICSQRINQMTVYVRLLRYRFEIINQFITKYFLNDENTIQMIDHNPNAVKNFTKLKAFEEKSTEEKILACKKLSEMRNAYQLLHEGADFINELFSWTLPLSLAQAFQTTLVCTYIFLICAINIQKDQLLWFGLVTMFVMTSYSFFHIVVISVACQCCVDEAKMVPALLHNIKFNETEEEMADMVSVSILSSILHLFLYIFRK